MREIANRGSIDKISLIHYMIQGINDSLQNKVLLFGCSDLTVFHQKLLIDEICQSIQKMMSGYTSDNPEFSPVRHISVQRIVHLIFNFFIEICFYDLSTYVI